MMSERVRLTYAKVGVTPGWQKLRVFDREQGDLVTRVIEVNTTEGWLIRIRTDEKGRMITDAVTGLKKFELLHGDYIILDPRP